MHSTALSPANLREIRRDAEPVPVRSLLSHTARPRRFRLSSAARRQRSRTDAPRLRTHPGKPPRGFLVSSRPMSTAFPPVPVLSFGHTAVVLAACPLGPFRPQDWAEVTHGLCPCCSLFYPFSSPLSPLLSARLHLGHAERYLRKGNQNIIFDLFLQHNDRATREATMVIINYALSWFTKRLSSMMVAEHNYSTTPIDNGHVVIPSL